MADFQVHQNKFIDVPFTVYDDINASPPVINTSAVATVQCPSGKANVGLTSNGNGRVLWIQGITLTAGQPVNVIVTANGKSDTKTLEVLSPVVDGRAVQIGSTPSAEYDGPAH